MKSRIQKFIDNEGITAGKFADEIGVQRSSVSHILAGRNYPGYDFIQKMLTRYKSINAEWLIMGTGEMHKQFKQASLFDIPTNPSPISVPEVNSTQKIISEPIEIPSVHDEEPAKYSLEADLPINNILPTVASDKKIERIVFFYTDKTFTAFQPNEI